MNVFSWVKIGTTYRISKKSFDEWYANQVKHRKVDGPEPGANLVKMSYSFRDVAEMLGVSDAVVYEIWNKNNLDTFTVDFVKRIPKKAFEKWYASQDRYRKRTHGTHVGEKRHPYMSREEAARIARVSPSTISRWSEKKYFKAVKTDRVLRINRKSFENWLNEREG